MGENKICSSCGNTIPAEAIFCPNCGGVQTASDGQAQGSEGPAASIEERIAQETGSVNETVKPVTSQTTFQPEPEKPPQGNALNKAPVQQPVSPRPAAPVQQGPVAPQQGYPQAQQPGQYYQQYAPAQPVQTPAKPKKKFPWVFTIVWVVMLAYLGIWGYCFVDPNYQTPEITVDTVRIVTFVVSAILLIYTLNLKLVTKKFKVVPTILLIVFLLVSLFMFASFELMDGEFPHDLLSPITDAIFQVN